MRCKKHLPDLSSSVGVCATCLRERLVALIAAQAQAQLRAQAQLTQDDRLKSDPHPPPLLFPRSVSPYVSRRKSDNAASNHQLHLHHHQHHSLPDQRFYSTPQVGPTGAIVTASSYKKKHSKFSLFSKLFRPKSDNVDLDRRVSDSNSGDMASTTTWFSSIFSGRRKKQSRLFSLDESTATGVRKPCRDRDRGMSPARYSNDGEDEECCDGSSGYASESPKAWKQTPIRATPQVRRGGGRAAHSRNVSGLAFCLSPLVRASPSRQWSQKGMPPDISFPGEIRVPVKPHLSTAASFCANRSRKLADFGRFNQTH